MYILAALTKHDIFKTKGHVKSVNNIINEWGSGEKENDVLGQNLLYEKAPIRSFSYIFIVSPQFGETLWEGLKDVALVEDMCHWRKA